MDDFRTIAHRFLHRRSEGRAASKIDEQTEKHDSELGRAGPAIGGLA